MKADDTLIDRIEQGTTTERDARVVSQLIARLAAYELALREIAEYGGGDASRIAANVLTSHGLTHASKG
jgi:ABC-type hemin transport system ATPase subunit